MRDADIKISSFITQTSLSTSDYIPIVKNGQNAKVSFATLLSEVGGIGTLVQKGESTAIPVLDIDGTTNNIRNIIGGPGVLPSLSPEDGIKIQNNYTVDATGEAIMTDTTEDKPTLRSIKGDSGISVADGGDSIDLSHNFTQDATGEPIVNDIAEISPVFKSLVAGTGMNISSVNGTVVITYSGVPSSSKTVIVNSIDDFPTPSSDVITLLDDTEYFLSSDISSANRFVLGEDTVLSGADGTLIELEYTGTGTMFTSADYSNKIKDIKCKCASGTLLDISGSVGDERFQIINTEITCDTIGTVDALYAFNCENVVWSVTTDGLTFLNNTDVISFFHNIGSITAGSFIKLGTSTFSGFSFTDSLGVLGAGATFITGAADSANVNIGGLASVINTVALGTGTALSGVTEQDSLWEFLANGGIADSRNTMLATHGGATIAIATADTPVIIGATWTAQELSRFEATATGRFTYVGSGAHLTLTATITADLASGVDDCTFYFYKNGSQIADSGIMREIDGGDPGNLSLIWSMDMATDDYVEVWCENNDSTADIVIEQLVLRIS